MVTIEDLVLDNIMFATKRCTKRLVAYLKAKNRRTSELLSTNGEVANEIFWESKFFKRSSVSPASRLGCVYHVHSDGEEYSEAGKTGSKYLNSY
jgi:hypothetical protein